MRNAMRSAAYTVHSSSNENSLNTHWQCTTMTTLACCSRAHTHARARPSILFTAHQVNKHEKSSEKHNNERKEKSAMPIFGQSAVSYVQRAQRKRMAQHKCDYTKKRPSFGSCSFGRRNWLCVADARVFVLSSATEWDECMCAGLADGKTGTIWLSFHLVSANSCSHAGQHNIVSCARVCAFVRLFHSIVRTSILYAVMSMPNSIHQFSNTQNTAHGVWLKRPESCTKV